MSNISFRKECRNCKFNTGLRHQITWLDDSEFIKADDNLNVRMLHDKILSFLKDTNSKCDNCKLINLWSISDIQIDDVKLPDDNIGIQFQLDNGNFVYTFNDIFFIVNNSIYKLNLSLNKPENIETAWKINIYNVFIILQSYYETNLIPSNELLEKLLYFFQSGNGIKFGIKEFDELFKIVLSWESKVLQVDYLGNYIEDYPDYLNFMQKIYPNMHKKHITLEVYKEFIKQYLNTRQFLYYFIDWLLPKFLSMDSDRKKRQEGITKLAKTL